MPKITLHEIDFQGLYQRWAQGAGPFSCFIRKTNFVTLKHYPDFVLQPVNQIESRLFRFVRHDLEPTTNKNLLIFDIPAQAGMRLGYLIQNHLQIKPILTYSSPLHPNGLVGGDAYVNALVGFGLGLQTIIPQGYAFILDNHRYRARVSLKTQQSKFNNQYEMTSDDLPSIEMLNALAYSEVTFYHRGAILEDLLGYIEYLRGHGIEVKEQEVTPSILK